MSDRLQELERRLEMAEGENKRKNEQLRKSFQELEEVGVEIQSYQTQADSCAAEIEGVMLQCELEKHWALESLIKRRAYRSAQIPTVPNREGA